MRKYTLLLTLFIFSFPTLSFAEKSLDANQKEVTSIENFNNLWSFSGYIKVLAELPSDDRTSELELDDLSIFASGNVNKWINLFVEAEYFSGTLWQSKGSKNFNDGSFIFERLYNDFHIGKKSRLRIGKFLAPVGSWNLIHAAPLVWTVNRPYTSTSSFSNYITGIGYGITLDDLTGSRLDFYAQANNEFDPKPLSKHPRRYNKVSGFSWTFLDNLYSRSSLDFQYAEAQFIESKRTTVSFHHAWYFQKWDIDAQLIYTDIKKGRTNIQSNPENIDIIDGWDGGGYIQTRYRINNHLNTYFRGEYFHFAHVNDSTKMYIGGMRYIFNSWGNLNVEYKHSIGPQLLADEGFSLSYNAMFKW